MIITKSVEVIRTEQIVVGKLCNKCGNVFEIFDESIQPINTNQGKYEICNDCELKFIRTFKHVPENFMNESGYVPAFITDHDLHQSLFEEWQRSGEWNYDDNPYKNDCENYDDCLEEDEVYEKYEEFYDAEEDRKPLHTSILRLVK